jgi:hypothetical protein
MPGGASIADVVRGYVYVARNAAMNHSYAGIRLACGSHPLMTAMSRQERSILGSLNIPVCCANSAR